MDNQGHKVHFGRNNQKQPSLSREARTRPFDPIWWYRHLYDSLVVDLVYRLQCDRLIILL